MKGERLIRCLIKERGTCEEEKGKNETGRIDRETARMETDDPILRGPIQEIERQHES